MTQAEEIKLQLAGKEKRRYTNLTAADRERIRLEYKSAPRGMKGPTARRLASEIGCSAQWVIIVGLS